jgi:hypothetical protein
MQKDNKKNIIVVINHPVFVINQVYWANAINKSKNWNAVVFWTFTDSLLEELLIEKNICKPKIIIRRGVFSKRVLLILNLLRKISNKIVFIRFLKILVDIVLESISSKLLINEARVYIKKFDAKAVLIPESTPSYFAPEIIFAANREKIGTFTTPIDRVDQKNFSIIYRTDKNLVPKGLDGWLISKYFPNWKIFDGHYFFRSEPAKILSQEFLGIASPSPWDMYGSMEDYMLVSSEINRIFYKSNCIDSKKIILIGNPQLDRLAVKNNLNNFDVDFLYEKPIILCALVQTHCISGRPEADFQNHREMVDVWINTLNSQDKYNVIISLHPSMNYNDFKYIESQRLKISRMDIIELLPLSSIFIASVSSTIPFALSLGIPVINYDVYRYSDELDYLKYKEAGGIKTVLNKTDFLREINRITSDETYYNFLRERQMADSWKWGKLDGGSVNRFIFLLDSLN